MLNTSRKPEWRQPELRAAVVNGVLIALVPAVWAAVVHYTSTDVRPFQPTVVTSAASAIPVLLGLLPIALVTTWRTYVHACAYTQHPRTVWRGPVESAAIFGTLALAVMVFATASTWGREPFHLVIAYIAFYVVATALTGLVLGLILATSALFVLYLHRHLQKER